MAWINRVRKVQRKAEKNILDKLKKGLSTYFVMPPGVGKTEVAFNVMEKFPSRVLWISITDELIDETVDRLSSRFPDRSIGIVKGKSDDFNAEVVVASINTIQNIDRRKYLKNFDLVIIDEVHHMLAPLWGDIFDYFNDRDTLILGFTATDVRGDGQVVDTILGKPCFKLTYQEAKNQKLVAEEEAYLILTSSVVEGVKIGRKDYSARDLDRKFVSMERNSVIVESYLEYGRKGVLKRKMKPKTVCFCVSQSHARRMSRLFRKRGISSDVLLSSMSTEERKLVYAEFKKDDSKIEVLCVVDIMNEGKNIPKINCVVFSRPTLSPTVYIQQNGRASRFIEGIKDFYIILDFVDNINRSFRTSCNFMNTLGGSLEKENLVLRFYRGRDPVIVEELLSEVSSNIYDQYRELYAWTQEKALTAGTNFYKEKGFLRAVDLYKVNNLPSRRTIENLFGSFKKYCNQIGIKGKYFNQDYSWGSKKQVEKSLIDFFKKHGSISITQLNRKNNLPSINTVKKWWPNFTQCSIDLGLYSNTKKYRYKKDVINSVREFERKHGRRPSVKCFKSSNNLPSVSILCKFWGSYHNFTKELYPEVAKKFRRGKMRGIFKRGNKYRAFAYNGKKTISIGSFSTVSAAIKERDNFEKKLRTGVC